MTIRATVTGIGHYLPARVVPNAEFAARLDTSDEWIRERTGIERRHFAAEGETTSSMAASAAAQALAMAGRSPSEVDAVILATSTPDLTFPSAATMVQKALGMTGGFAFDLQAVCAGFVYALTTANALMLTGQARRVLVIGSETFSRILDWDDRTTCVLFGDGAGALLLEAAEGEGTAADRGVLATDLHSDGSFKDLLYVDGGISTGRAGRPADGRARRCSAMPSSSSPRRPRRRWSGRADARGRGLDRAAPGQPRIIKATAQKMGVPMERVVVTVQDHGNTSAASIPLRLSVGVERGQIKPGDLLVMEAIGGGPGLGVGGPALVSAGPSRPLTARD
jgi:3-oxoacyl-[acyl-carrier-protein] synthase-3